jgi:DNA invertase Pin-like site-specific DNA recombinase
MAEGRLISYCRVSSAKQGRSGLGLDAQRAAVQSYLNGGSWTLLAEFTEVESGKRTNRPELARALELCRMTGATLVIAKLDRLTRNVAFLANLMESGVAFIACDNPHATKFTVHILAAVAEHEREAIAKRTREALAAAKARGKTLGGWRHGPVVNGRLGIVARRAKTDAFAASLAPTLNEMRQSGLSLHGMAAELTRRGYLAPRRGTWTATTVKRVLARAMASGASSEACTAA